MKFMTLHYTVTFVVIYKFKLDYSMTFFSRTVKRLHFSPELKKRWFGRYFFLSL